MTTHALRLLLGRARALTAVLREIVTAREACPHAATAADLSRGSGSQDLDGPDFGRQSAARADWYHLAEMRLRWTRLCNAFAEADGRGFGRTISARLRVAVAVLGAVGERRGRPKKRPGYSGACREFPHGVPRGVETADAVARLVGLGSGWQLRRALKVLRSGDAALVAALDGGALSVAEAARQVREGV